MDVLEILSIPKSLQEHLDNGNLWVDRQGKLLDSNGRIYEVCSCVVRENIPLESFRILVKNKLRFLEVCENCFRRQEETVRVLLDYFTQ